MVDVTLSAEGQLVHAHRIILASSSSYLEVFTQHLQRFHQTKQFLITSQNLFDGLPSQKLPVVVFKDITFRQLNQILQFLYLGSSKMEASEVKGFQRALKSLNIPMGDISSMATHSTPMEQQQPGPSTITVGNDTFVFGGPDESLTIQEQSDTPASADSSFSTQVVWPQVETLLSAASSSTRESNGQGKQRNAPAPGKQRNAPPAVEPKISRFVNNLKNLSDNQPKASQADPEMDVQFTEIKTEPMPQKDNKITAQRRHSEYPRKLGSKQCPICLKYFCTSSYVKKHAKDVHDLSM